MASYDLNKLVDGLQNSRDRAQQRLDRHQERLLEALIEIGRDGEPTSLCWVSRLPSGDGSYRTHELVRLPWASLRNASPEYVTSASIRLDCQVATATTPSAAETETGSLKLMPVWGRRAKSVRTHRLEINLGTEGEGSAEIRLDKQRLKSAGTDELQIPPEIMEALLTQEGRHRRFPVGKILVALVLIGLLSAAAVWFLGFAPSP